MMLLFLRLPLLPLSAAAAAQMREIRREAGLRRRKATRRCCCVQRCAEPAREAAARTIVPRGTRATPLILLAGAAEALCRCPANSLPPRCAISPLATSFAVYFSLLILLFVIFFFDTSLHIAVSLSCFRFSFSLMMPYFLRFRLRFHYFIEIDISPLSDAMFLFFFRLVDAAFARDSCVSSLDPRRAAAHEFSYFDSSEMRHPGGWRQHGIMRAGCA